MDFGLDSIFNTKNGLIYNWQDWINNEIEKKYAGDIDIPNDYIPANLRTESNGFIDKTGWSKEKLAAWDKVDKAYLTLKTNPNNWSAKEIVKDLPEGYVPVEKRKTVQDSWTKYEEQLKSKGYVDPKVSSTWSLSPRLLKGGTALLHASTSSSMTLCAIRTQPLLQKSQ
jgi:hypothetical protein